PCRDALPTSDCLGGHTPVVDEFSGPAIAHLPVETTYRLLLIGTHLTVAGSVHSILEVELLGEPFTDKHSHRPIHRGHRQTIIDTLLIQGCDDLLVARHDSVLVVEELTVRTSLAHLLVGVLAHTQLRPGRGRVVQQEASPLTLLGVEGL